MNANDAIETTRVIAVGSGGSAVALFGVPWGEVAALFTAIYVLCKIITLSPKMLDSISSLKERVKGWFDK